MSPEIMLGMDFDNQSDVFSYGVISAELLGWKISDGLTFMKRKIPGFGFEEKELRRLNTIDTPAAYIEMVLKCVEIDPLKRINIKQVQSILKDIENSLTSTKNVGVFIISKTNLDQLDLEPIATEEPKSNILESSKIMRVVNSEVFSEESQYPSLQRVNKASVIGHNIPHRFSIHRSGSLVKKCEQCDKHVYFKHLVCDECSCVAHLECGDKLPSFCGLTKSLQNLVSPHKSVHSAESMLSSPGGNVPTRS
eukprot:NODE_794_length_4196_cov_0.103246.p1 type:complete len:251 gc:universal NODE_794_length_4196_cov_0.103246:2458-3210(+)